MTHLDAWAHRPRAVAPALLDPVELGVGRAQHVGVGRLVLDADALDLHHDGIVRALRLRGKRWHGGH
eukprot:3048760-Alexandrium_andersonii.AAC.1